MDPSAPPLRERPVMVADGATCAVADTFTVARTIQNKTHLENFIDKKNVQIPADRVAGRSILTRFILKAARTELILGRRWMGGRETFF